MGEIRNAYKVFVRKVEEKRSLGRPRHRWEATVKIGITVTGGRVWNEFIWHKLGIIMDEHSDEYSESIFQFHTRQAIS
jgi:hypothetical protein